VLLAQAQAPAEPNPSAASSTPQDGGSISGTVEDPSGSRAPGCLVVLHNESGASVQTVRSDPTGAYRFSSIQPGHYSLEYQMPGFRIRRAPAEVEAGKAVRVDAKLEVGQITQTVTVVGQRPTPSAARPAPPPGAISVGGRVEAARLIRQPQAVYPPELLQQGVEGTVRLTAVISREGVPGELHVLNTDQIDSRFIEAALDAVQRWRYQPTKLNGQPIPVLTTIDVTFELGK
jgi:TonB family protein